MSAPADPRVVAVVVSYNRRDLLMEALEALAAQSTSVAQVVVVDNASTDDSAAVAKASRALVDLVVLRRNTGGAGGFAAGLARALERHEPDWVWLMDDDTIPTLTAMEQLLATARAADAVVAGSRVAWTDGSDHPMNTPRRKPFVSRREAQRAEAAGGFAIRSTSFVSMLVRADAARMVGLPIADFFIWNDDFEYSTRLLRGGRGVFAPSSVVVHKTRVLGAVDADPGERFYFEVRNKLWMLRYSRSLSGAEKALYGASTVVRWVRTVRRSRNRAVVVAAFRRGWRDGWRTSPRSTTELLGDTAVAADVERVERAVWSRR